MPLVLTHPLLPSTPTASSFIRATLEGEYPKLLRLCADVITRLHQYLRQPGAEPYDLSEVEAEDSALRRRLDWTAHTSHTPPRSHHSSVSLAMFESHYLQRSLVRMFDPVHLVFPQGGKMAPSPDEVLNICKVGENARARQPISVSSHAHHLVSTTDTVWRADGGRV